MRIFILLILILFSRASTHALDMNKFKINDVSLSIAYKRYGESCSSVKSRTKADFVFGGGYFNPRSYEIIDYTSIDNKVLCRYRWDWARPILILDKGNVKFLRQATKKKLTNKITTGIALDYKTTNPYKVVGRQVVAIKDGYIYFIKMYSTEKYCRALLKKYGLTDYAFCDGGSSTPSWAIIPSHIYLTKGNLYTE